MIPEEAEPVPFLTAHRELLADLDEALDSERGLRQILGSEEGHAALIGDLTGALDTGAGLVAILALSPSGPGAENAGPAGQDSGKEVRSEAEQLASAAKQLDLILAGPDGVWYRMPPALGVHPSPAPGASRPDPAGGIPGMPASQTPSERGPAIGSFEEFVALCRPGLLRLARALLKDPQQADDVVQDVLSVCLAQWPQLRASRDADAQVRQMLVNACPPWLRRARRRERVTEQSLIMDRTTASRPDQALDHDGLIALLRRLPAKQRAVIVLRHYEGLPDAEIAQILNCSEVTVRSSAHRALTRLRKLITEQAPESRS